MITWSKVTAVSCLTAQKTPPNLVWWCLFAFANVHVHATQLVCYSWRVVDQMLFLSILFMCTHTVSPRGVPSTQPWCTINYFNDRPLILIFCIRYSAQCIQCTGYYLSVNSTNIALHVINAYEGGCYSIPTTPPPPKFAPVMYMYNYVLEELCSSPCCCDHWVVLGEDLAQAPGTG